ncbi:MAG: hypothetical protein K0Q68_1179 [Moraxellaceae bacterium]|nr:hypothetical protein [Moraxellaceae bacterium]
MFLYRWSIVAVTLSDQARQSRPLLLGLLMALLLLAFGELLISLERARELQAARTHLQIEASAMRARLESELAASFSVGLSAASLVSSKPDFSTRDYERLARSLAGWYPGLRNIAIAPDNVVRYVYPRQGNEKALGANLEQVPAQREAALAVRREWKPLVSGPVELVQGGVGIVHRVPILVPAADDAPRYWGLVSVVIDPAPLFRRIGLSADADVVYALRGRDGRGESGAVFFGNAAQFRDRHAIRMDVLLPGGQWQLAAGWRTPPDALTPRYLLWHALALLLALGGGTLVTIAARSQLRLQVLASQDSLTGLANRNQFLFQARAMLALAARQKYPFTVLNLDLEGFKGINDDFGHEIGDAMLVHVAQQARECLRASDLIARFGGDEFLVLLPDTEPGPVLEALVARLRGAIAQPLNIKGHTLSVGISVGAASYPGDGFSMDDLMRVADFNMYANKRSRRKVEG